MAKKNYFVTISSTEQHQHGRNFEIVIKGSLPHLNFSHLAPSPHLRYGLRRHPDPLTLQHNNKKTYIQFVHGEVLYCGKGICVKQCKPLSYGLITNSTEAKHFICGYVKARLRLICLPLCSLEAGSGGFLEGFFASSPTQRVSG